MATSCTNCHKGLKIREELVGKRIKCPACGTSFLPTSMAAPQSRPTSAPMPSAAFSRTSSSGSSGGVLNGSVIFGLALILLGVGITVASAMTAKSGGSYVVCTGMIGAGIFRTIRGLASN